MFQCVAISSFPYAGSQPERSVPLTALEIHKRAGNPFARGIMSWFITARTPA
jgi:hypothetical protein